ncbi:MAG: hypothetical protein MJ109_05175 [Kiritimatiellae bacterium]|nr:hypothetical protein [Kiritimatiellia bacterium]
MFRDAREPWVATKTLGFDGNQISITDIGLSVVHGDATYGETLVETFKSYNETGTTDNPFSIICECLLTLPTGNAISIEDVIKIMRHYRPGGDDDLLEVLAAEDENVSNVTERRLKNIMTLLAYSGALTIVGKDYFLASRSVAEEITGKSSLKEHSSGRKLSDGGVHQLITYGAPGTGKSYRTKLETEGHAVYRTTFHPDSDYSTFVGAYKPTMSKDAGLIEVYKGSGSSKILDVTHEVKKGISYDFVPQAFIKAYVDAWQKMNAEAEGAARVPVFLVIEEINRGNCAQIFGDLFQLLDRGEDGYSDYPIDTDSDLKRFLSDAEQLGKLSKIREEVRAGAKLVLPPNLYIRATMNTSDQSLFPIDSAFKRRWEWKYVPIAKPTKAGWVDRVIVADSKAYSWWDFLLKANEQILNTTKSEDKQLGYFFVKAPDATGHIKADRFSGKVLFYLYNDVFKDYALPAELFGDGSNGSTKYEFKMFFDELGETKESVVAAFLEQLGLTGTPVNPV